MTIYCEGGQGCAFVCVCVSAAERVCSGEAAQYGNTGVGWEVVRPDHEAHLVVVVWSWGNGYLLPGKHIILRLYGL